jgi:hypothetical protein
VGSVDSLAIVRMQEFCYYVVAKNVSSTSHAEGKALDIGFWV